MDHSSSLGGSREDRLRAHKSSVSNPGYRDDYRDRDNGQRRYDSGDRRSYQDRGYKERSLEDRQLQKAGDGTVVVKEKPNFKPTGLLAKESNNIKGTQLKYTEPEDSAEPPKTSIFTLFIFKADSKITRQYELNTKSHHLIGRDEKVVDLETDDETCSKQHAVIQWRTRPSIDKKDGKVTRSVKPFIIDLDSSNGTFINGKEIPGSSFVELKEEDVLRFGDSTTDYVVMLS